VPRQDFVDERLIPDTPTPCFLAELLEDPCIDANGNQLAGLSTEGRATHTPHGRQLPYRRIWNIREVNLSPSTPHVRGDSLVVR